jgi:hypothetical protein
MVYSWEKKINLELIIEMANLDLPDYLTIIGLAVVNTDSVEACLKIKEDWVGGDVSQMDAMYDISGDADRLYKECRLASKGLFEKRRFNASNREKTK